jgi:hypothetical protein
MCRTYIRSYGPRIPAVALVVVDTSRERPHDLTSNLTRGKRRSSMLPPLACGGLPGSGGGGFLRG